MSGTREESGVLEKICFPVKCACWVTGFNENVKGPTAFLLREIETTITYVKAG